MEVLFIAFSKRTFSSAARAARPKKMFEVGIASKLFALFVLCTWHCVMDALHGRGELV